MKSKKIQPEKPKLISMYKLGMRWQITAKTALRYCRFNQLKVNRLTDKGQYYVMLSEVEALEQRVFVKTSSRKSRTSGKSKPR